MTFWEILRIEPTDDPSAVKKAYAKMLKVYHPEDDPQGYQRLREAYDAIRKDLKKGNRAFVEKKSPLPIEREGSPVAVYMPEQDEREIESNQDNISNFILQASRLYDNAPERIQLRNWIDLLNEPVLWDLTFKKEAGIQLFDFLKVHHFLPKDVWLLLEDSFQWSETYPEFLLNEDPDRAHFCAYYQKHLGFYPSLSFEEIARKEKIESDPFLQNRESALDAFLAGHLEEAKLAAENAFAIFPDDPDLLKILGEIHIQLNKFEEAASFYERYLEQKPEDKEAKLSLARMEYDQRNRSKALSLCKELAASYPQDPDILSLYAKSLLKEKEAGEALHSFQEIRTRYSYDTESMVYSAKIHRYLWDGLFGVKEKSSLPTRLQLKTELRKSTLIERIQYFSRYVFKRSVFLSIFLLIIGWNGVVETTFANPFVFMLMILGSFVFPNVSLSYIDSMAPFVCLALFVLSCFFLIRSLFRAYKAVRY